MSRRRVTGSLVLMAGLAGLTGLSACGEKPQVSESRAVGVPAYMGVGVSAYADPSWKAGDATNWEEQMRTRTQSGQNEYGRTGGR